ncbi:hypothetical protein LCGC14_0960010 [marine sediment metagenome]|uniref:Uncharacterized protein n=2 Tax=root TaxID=1 RepID=A0A831QR48_9FLAO|nr:hypothetical protein [Pricia antarctica]
MKRQLHIFGMILSSAVLWFGMSALGYTHKKERSQKVFTAYLKDSVEVEVYLVYDEREVPLKYFSHIKSPVCEEGICYELIVDLHWDVLGHFLEYREEPKNPFTKFDHIRFSESDHQKLKSILADKTSLLANYDAEELVDTEIEIQSDIIDAVTGATYQSLKGAVVPGAVYSSHTLWHIVNDNISDQIMEHTESVMNDPLLISLLESKRYNLQLYALKKVDFKIDKYVPYVFRLISEGESYVPYFAIEKIPQEIWASTIYQEKSIRLLEKVEFKLQNEILGKLQHNSISDSSLRLLTTKINVLDKNQIEKVFQILYANKDKLTRNSIDEIASLLSSDEILISTSAYDLLKKVGLQYKHIVIELKEYKYKTK